MAGRKVQRTSTPPARLLYFPDFISEEEEHALLTILAEIPYHDFVLQVLLRNGKLNDMDLNTSFTRR